MSAALAERGVDHSVLEAGEVGQTWKNQRWDSFRLNTPGWMNLTLGPMPDDHFCTRDEVVERLHANTAGLPIRTHSRVDELSSNGSGFSLRTSDEQIDASAVVIASGGLNVPIRLPYADRISSRTTQLHAADYRSAGQLPEGAVLVVGAGQSGCQIAEDLRLAGRRVYLATCRVGRYNWSYRGLETFRWLDQMGFWDQRPEDLPDPGIIKLAQPQIASAGRTLNIVMLAAMGVTLLGRLQSVERERLTFDGSLGANAEFGHQFWQRMHSMIDAHIALSNVTAPVAETDPGLGRLTNGGPTTVDLVADGVSAVVWCTGFTGDLTWVRLPILDGDGRPAHRGNATEVPRLWLLGFPWLSRRRSGILYGFPVEAAEISDSITAELAGRA